MRIIETLTTDDKLSMFGGDVVGIFKTLFKEGDPLLPYAYELCLGYYTMESADKTISPAFERYLNLQNDYPENRFTADGIMGNVIRGKFMAKWNKLYNAIVAQDYDILHDYDKTTHRTANNLETTEYDSGVTTDGKTATSETVTRSTTAEDNTYGFNSEIEVPTDVSNDVFSETLEGEADKNTSHSTQTRSGADTVTKDIDDTTQTSGRATNAPDLITKEIDLREKFNLFNIIYRDIDSMTAIGIYL